MRIMVGQEHILFGRIDTHESVAIYYSPSTIHEAIAESRVIW